MGAKNIEAVFPLSPMQQGMLFQTQYAPQSGAYVVQLSCRLEGELNVSSFERAWQQTADRNSTLRTAFVWRKVESPLQVVGQQVKLTWNKPDWRGLSHAEQAERLRVFLDEDRTR